MAASSNVEPSSRHKITPLPLDSPLQVYTLLCVSAAAGGAVNSVAGGGTLLTFPAVFAALGGSAEAAVVANATSTIALWPGSMSAFWGYRREIADSGEWVRRLALPSLAGGLLGSILVVALPPESFKVLVPWLILIAATLFALQPQITRWTGIGQAHQPATARTLLGVMVFQFLISVYGGYFGAGIGILMLTALAMMGLTDIHKMNALKTLLASLINGVSVAVFVAGGKVHWPFAAAMAISAIIGGYVGAVVARRLDRQLVRSVVVLIGFTLAVYYFYDQFIAS